jgi:hypothetical protein
MLNRCSTLARMLGAANPVVGRITSTIGQGTSQSRNAMKTFLHLGFNQALDGGKVFDGFYSHAAARETNISTRFAVPGGGAMGAPTIAPTARPRRAACRLTMSTRLCLVPLMHSSNAFGASRPLWGPSLTTWLD